MSELGDAVRAGDRRALGRAITLVESTRADHRRSAEALLDELLGATGGAVRLGLSGPPGVGKSTFIEALGRHVLEVEPTHLLAVLAVDPSSSRSGGSILGDKTRMEELSRDPRVFIRPSPGGGHLGGVARRTREVLLLCEAAGADLILVETIGVGQSEVAVAELTDLFLLLVNPGGGDELQGIKRGIMELADLVVVTKNDGDLAAAAGRAEADYRNALGLLRPKWSAWSPTVLRCSSVTGEGIPEVWEAVGQAVAALRASGELAELRRRQVVAWMWDEIDDALGRRFREAPAVREALTGLEDAVARGSTSPGSAASRLLEIFGI